MLELFLAAILIFVIVAISFVIVARKVHAARGKAREVRANTLPSSLTVSGSPGGPGRDQGIPLSTSPGVTGAAGGDKMAEDPGRPRGDTKRGSDGAMV